MAAYAIYNSLCRRAKTSVAIATALDPDYVFVHWKGTRPTTYSTTLRSLMHKVCKADVMPTVAGSRAIRLVEDDDLDVLHVDDASVARKVVDHIQQSHPGQTRCHYVSAQIPLTTFG